MPTPPNKAYDSRRQFSGIPKLSDVFGSVKPKSSYEVKPSSPYDKKGNPTGSPTGKYWGELTRFTGPRLPGMDIWGGTEPGSKFKGTTKDVTDYQHQLGEQPRPVTRGGPKLDKPSVKGTSSGGAEAGPAIGLLGGFFNN